MVQSSGKGRTGLGEVQGMARSGSELRAHTGVVDQGSAAAVVGSDGGDALAMDCCGLVGTAGLGHERAQAAAGLRALITGQARRTAEVESRAREQREQVTGLKWLTAGGS